MAMTVLFLVTCMTADDYSIIHLLWHDDNYLLNRGRFYIRASRLCSLLSGISLNWILLNQGSFPYILL